MTGRGSDRVSGDLDGPAELLVPRRFQDPVAAYGYQRTVFEQVASGARSLTISITPSTRHVGVTRRDTRRPGFEEAVRASNEAGYPVMVRGSGGGATAADEGTFGFSIVRPAGESEIRRGINDRYDEAAALVIGGLSRIGVEAEVGEVRAEFCPGDHSIRVGSWERGMKLVGIAQRLTRRATSVGGIVLVHGEEGLASILERIYGAMELPFRAGSVGSLRKAGVEAGVDEVIEAFAAEAETRYGARRTAVDEATLAAARRTGSQHLISR
ncbi:MAG: biotin/lipoate A/B protein ligase family protein [Rubrobacteraceae bacterium]